MKLNEYIKEVSDIPKSFILEELKDYDRTQTLKSLGNKILQHFGLDVPSNSETMRKRVSKLYHKHFAAQDGDNIDNVDLPSIKGKSIGKIVGKFIPTKNMSPKFEGEKEGFTEEQLSNFKEMGYTVVNGEPVREVQNFPYFEDKVKKTMNPLHNGYKVGQPILPVIYLVIGDIHCPADNIDYLQHCLDTVDKYTTIGNSYFGVGKWTLKVIFIGDIIDLQAISYHEINPNMESAGDELLSAKVNLSDWYKQFPNVMVTFGNHDLRVVKKSKTAGINQEWLRPLEDVLGVPNWKFVDMVIDTQYDIIFTHGTLLNERTIKDYARDEQMSVVAGHLHSLSYIKNISQKLWVSHIGCGINTSHPAFNYSRGGHLKSILSCLVIFDGQPILEVMKEV